MKASLLDNVENAQLGMGIIRSLIESDANEVQNKAVKAYTEGNMQLWQSRLKRFVGDGGGEPAKEAGLEGDDVGHTVSIGNEIHNHYSSDSAKPAAAASGLSTLGKALVAASLLTGGAGMGAAALMYLQDDPPAVQQPHVDTNTDTTLSIEIPPEDRI